MQVVHAEESDRFFSMEVATLTWDLSCQTSTLLTELFMTGTLGLMGGSGKLQYSLSFELPKLTIKPLRA